MSVLFSLHGVHGSGKSFISEPVAHDRGFYLVKSDAADKFSNITQLNPFFRQSTFLHSAILGYAYALGLGEHHPVILDFGPRQVIPYNEWWAREHAKTLEEMLERSLEPLEKKANTKIVNVFFIVERDPKIILRRIMGRQRTEELKEEEKDERYLRFINDRFKEIMEELERRGHIVEKVPADATIHRKLNTFWKILDKHTEEGRP